MAKIKEKGSGYRDIAEWMSKIQKQKNDVYGGEEHACLSPATSTLKRSKTTKLFALVV